MTEQNHTGAAAQPQQEPVAWTNRAQLDFLKDPEWEEVPMAMWDKCAEKYADVPLYASQPPAAPVEWEGSPQWQFAQRLQAYLDDAPLDGRHSDAAGGNAYDLIAEAIEWMKPPTRSSAANEDLKALFSDVTKHDLASALRHLRDFFSVPQLEHRKKYADLIEAQAKLIAHLVNRDQPQEAKEPIGFAAFHPKRGWRVDLAAKTEQIATSVAMRSIDGAAADGWEVRPFFASQVSRPEPSRGDK